MPLYLLDAELDENDPVDRWITARLYEGNPHTRLGAVRAARHRRASGRSARSGSIRASCIQRGPPGARRARARHRGRRRRRVARRRARRGARARACSRRTRPSPPATSRYQPELVPRGLRRRPRATRAWTTAGSSTSAAPQPGTDEWPGMTPLALRMTRRANGVSLRHGRSRERCGDRCTTRPGGRGADHPRDERRPPADLPGAADARAPRPPPRRRAGSSARPSRRRGRPSTTSPTRSSGRARNDARRRARRVRQGEERAGPAAARRGPETSRPRRRDVRARHADARVRAPDRDLQAAPPAHLRPGARPPDLRRRAAGADGRGRQGAPARREREADARATCSASRRRSASRRPRRVPRGLRPRASPRRSSAAATSGSTSPRPPLEASGTSGMKSAVNGGLNLSVLDGWWAEGYDGDERLGDRRRRARADDRAAQDARRRAALLRPARARGRAALLRPRRRRHPARLARDGQAVAAHERAALLAQRGWSRSTRRRSILPFRKARFRSSGIAAAPTPTAGRNPEASTSSPRPMRRQDATRSGSRRDEQQ